MRIAEILSEAKIFARIDLPDKEVRVVENPLPSDLAALVAKAKFHNLRAILNDDGLYVWDAYEATHNEVGYNTGLTGLRLEMDTLHAELSHDGEYGDKSNKQLHDEIVANRHLLRAYGGNPRVDVVTIRDWDDSW